MPAFADRIGFGRIGKRERRDLRDFHRAAGDQLSYPFEMRAIAPDLGAQAFHIRARRGRRGAARRDEGSATARLQYQVRTRSDIAADGVEHGIDVGHDLGEIIFVVVDDLVGTELADVLDVSRARRRDDARTDVLGNLDRKARDAARAALYQYRFAGFELQRVFNRAERGDSGQCHCGSFDVRRARPACAQ